MKKTLIILALLVPSVSMASIDNNLKYSQSGNEVVELQDFLVDKGFLKNNPTGYFGLLTFKAVQEYQASVGLPNTGYVGLLTRGKINSELTTIVSVSKEAEIAETGTTTPVVNLNQPVRGVSEPTQTMNLVETKLAKLSDLTIVNNANSHFRDDATVSVELNDAKSVIVTITSVSKTENGLKSRLLWEKMYRDNTTGNIFVVASKTTDNKWGMGDYYKGVYNWTVVSFSDTGKNGEDKAPTQKIGETTGTFEVK